MTELKQSTTVAVTLGAGAGSAGAALALTSVTTGSFGDGWHSLYDSSTAAQALGAVLAAIVASVRMRSAARLLVVLGAALILGSVRIVDTDDSLMRAYVISILAGVVLGGIVGWAVDAATHIRLLTTVVAVGAIVGVVLNQPLSNPFVYYPGGEPTQVISLQSVTVALLVITMTLAAGLNPQVRQAMSSSMVSPSSPRIDRRAAVLGVGVAVMAVAVIGWNTATVGDDESFHEWYFGYVQVAIILAVAVILGGTGGAALAAFAAWTASRAGDTSWIPDHRAWLIVAVAAVIAGALFGRRVGRPLVGIAVLAVCAATYLFYGSAVDEVYSFTVLFVAPGAVAFTVGALLRSGREPAAGALAIALAGPAFWILSPRAHEFFFTYIGNERPKSFDVSGSYGPHTFSMATETAIPMIVAVLVCGAVLLLILRRAAADRA
ncbi:hypothetical protein OG579_11885 [Williamsia herbipolensis]|uniref:Uncharacterized protein n=1 Tax=Williamsia herbipolensis TaxID=1603258 RepID=A0AAU4JXC8_9NOCA|nr:hypothetical protein [Williamsia herbipolensis]